MPVTLTDASASIAAIVLEQYLEDRHREVQHFTRMSAILGTDEPRVMDERTRIAIELVLAEINASLTHDKIAGEIRDEHLLRDILREVREPRTIWELAARDPLGTPADHLLELLEELEERGHVRQLKNGTGAVTWEITEAGEQTL
jgi:hypothetical protein